jgi:hypothetical protein
MEEYCYEANHFFFSDFYHRLRMNQRFNWRVRGYWILEETYKAIVTVYRQYFVEHLDLMPVELIDLMPVLFSGLRPWGQKIKDQLYAVNNYDDLLEVVRLSTIEMNKEFRNLMTD